jgi:hypothetical protein
VRVPTIWSLTLMGFAAAAFLVTAVKFVGTPVKWVTTRIKMAERMAVVTKIRSVSPIILPTLPVSFVLAMEPAMEKKIRGTIRQKRRLRKICPIGLRKETLSPKTRPNIAPITHPVIRMIGSR